MRSARSWLGAALACAVVAVQADPAPADVDFVGKVSQGGAFEVQAGLLAVEKAVSPAVKSFAQQDAAEHETVNVALKKIATSQHIVIAPSLAPGLQDKLDALRRLSGAAFDKAYVAEMADIHRTDEALFGSAAKTSGNPDVKTFAQQTDAVVKRHLELLATLQPATN